MTPYNINSEVSHTHTTSKTYADATNDFFSPNTKTNAHTSHQPNLHGNRIEKKEYNQWKGRYYRMHKKNNQSYHSGKRGNETTNQK